MGNFIFPFAQFLLVLSFFNLLYCNFVTNKVDRRRAAEPMVYNPCQNSLFEV